MTKKENPWEISKIIEETSKGSLERKFIAVRQLAESFTKKYYGRISTLSTREVLNCIKNYESIEEELQNISLYSNLSYSSNMTLKKNQALDEQVNKLLLQIEASLVFFDLEVGSLVTNEY